ncbi:MULTISPECIES: hypothetical protein [Streptomyces]|uniref:hypothetical protein n=1 Tax=Streptomyces TaxID=1883 RepID=UPI00345C21E3
MALFNRGREQDRKPGYEPLLLRPPGEGTAEFDQAEVVRGYGVLRWETPAGGIGLVHSLRDGNAYPRSVIDALYGRHGERLASRYACVVVAQAGTQVSEPYVPRLLALDVLPGLKLSEQYEPRWKHLAATVGMRAPYWFASLRDRETIAAWRPGAPPAVVPACHVTNRIDALVELAADEPDGSPAARLCWSLAREIRARDHKSVTRDIQELQDNAADSGDGAHLVLGAVPAELRRPDEEPLPEVVRRAGWLSITERRDVLAHRVAALAQRWDGGQDWHTGDAVVVRPDECTTAREWARRLRPVTRDQAPTVLEQELLTNARDTETDELLHDPVTGVPAIRRRKRWPQDEPEDIFTLALQRLPTTSPLAALTVSDHTPWIRTQDGTLWPAPARSGYGISWGYNGTGNHTLARLVDKLLDDISAPAVTPREPDPAQGLVDLLRTTPQDGTTTYNRAQLLAARAG